MMRGWGGSRDQGTGVDNTHVRQEQKLPMRLGTMTTLCICGEWSEIVGVEPATKVNYAVVGGRSANRTASLQEGKKAGDKIQYVGPDGLSMSSLCCYRVHCSARVG